MKKTPNDLITFVFVMFLVVLVVFLGHLANARADETVTKGYIGSEYINTVETPVKGQKGTTVERGYIDSKYVNLRTTRTPKRTRTTGWMGSEYVNTTTTTKKVKDND